MRPGVSTAGANFCISQAVLFSYAADVSQQLRLVFSWGIGLCYCLTIDVLGVALHMEIIRDRLVEVGDVVIW